MVQEGPNEGANRPVEVAVLRKAVTELRNQSGLSTLQNDPRAQPPQPRVGEHVLTRFFRLDALAPSADPGRPQPVVPELNQKNIRELVEQSRTAARAPNASWDQQMTATVLEYYLTRERLPANLANRAQIEAGTNMHVTRLLTNIYGATEFISTFDLYVKFLEDHPAAAIHRDRAVETRLLEDARVLTALMPYWGRVIQVHFLSIQNNQGEAHQKELKAARAQLEIARKAATAAGVDVPADVANLPPAALLMTITPVEQRLRDIVFAATATVRPPRHNPSTIERLVGQVADEGQRKQLRQGLTAIGMTEGEVQPIEARRVHAAYINMLVAHRRSESDQIIKKAGSGQIPSETVVRLFREHQEIGQLIMQEHLFGFQTTTAHMFAGTLGVADSLQQNPNARGNVFTGNQATVVFADFLQLMEMTPGDPAMQKSLQEQRVKSVAAVRNYLRYMRAEALQLRVSLRLLDGVYIQPAMREITDGMRVISDFLEGRAATVANWTIWGPLLAYYVPALRNLPFETDPLRARQEARKILEAALKEGQENLARIQSLHKTIGEAQAQLEQAEKDIEPHLKIIEGMDAAALMDPKRRAEARAALEAITKIQQASNKTIVATWQRIEVNMQEHAKTVATLAGIQNSIARTVTYVLTAAGVVLWNVIYNRVMSGSLVTPGGLARFTGRSLLSVAAPFYSPLEMAWNLQQWARGGGATTTIEIVDSAVVAEANRLRRLGDFGNRLSPGTRGLMSGLNNASTAVQRYGAGVAVLSDLGQTGAEVIRALGTLTPAELDTVRNAILRVHELGDGPAFFDQKIQALLELQNHPTIGPKLSSPQWRTFRSAFLRTGICGQIPIEMLGIARAIESLSPQLRLILQTRTSGSQAFNILSMCAESPDLLRALNALPDIQLQQALRVLGSPAMQRGLDIALLDAQKVARLMELIGAGSPAQLRGFLALTQEARVLVLGMQQAELARILALCGESVEARAAILVITDLARLRTLAAALAEPAVAALLAREGIGITEAIALFSDAARVGEVAAVIAEARAAGTAVQRSRLLNMIAASWRGTRTVVVTTARGVGHVLGPLAVAGEVYMAYDSNAELQSMKQAVGRLHESMVKLLPPGQFREETRSVNVNGRSESHQVFVHIESEHAIDFTQLINAAESLRGSDFIRRATDIAAIAGALAIFGGPVGIAASLGIMLLATISRELQAASGARKWRSFLAALPPIFLTFLPTNVFGGDRYDNYQLYLFLRSHRPVVAPEAPRLSDTRTNNPNTRLGQEALTDPGLERVVLFSFVQEFGRQQVPMALLCERPGQNPLDIVIRDIGFLHECFARLFTEQTRESYSNAITRAVEMYVDQKFAQFYQREAPLVGEHQRARDRLSKDVTFIVGFAPIPAPDDLRVTVRELAEAIAAGSPAETGFRAIAGIPAGPLTGTPTRNNILVPLELFEREQAMTILTEIGSLPDADRRAVVFALQALSARQCYWMLELFLPHRNVDAINQVNYRRPFLESCRRAAENGLIDPARAAALTMGVEAVGNRMLTGGTFSVREYVERSANNLETSGLPRSIDPNRPLDALVAVNSMGEQIPPMPGNIADIEQIVGAVLLQPRDSVTVRRARTALSGDGQTRREVGLTDPGIDCYVATFAAWTEPPRSDGIARAGTWYSVFFLYNQTLRRWFWASEAAPAFLPVNTTIDANQTRSVRAAYSEAQAKANPAWRAFNDLANAVSRQEFDLRLPPHPRAQDVWQAAQKISASYGAVPETFPGGISGMRYTSRGTTIWVASIGGRLRWKTASEEVWRHVNVNRWSSPTDAAHQEMNRIMAQLTLVEDNLAAPHDMAASRESHGRTFFADIVGHANVTEVTVEGYRGYSVTDNGSTIECVFFGGAWFVREPRRGIMWWWNPADYNPGGNNSHTLITIVHALNSINHSSPSSVTAGAIGGRTEGRELLRGLVDSAGAAKATKALFQENLQLADVTPNGSQNGTSMETQRPAILANRRSSGHLQEFADLARIMHATFDEQTGITTISRLPLILLGSSDMDALQIRNSAGQWQFRYRQQPAADAEANLKLQAERRNWGAWTPLRTDRPVFADSISFEQKINQSALQDQALPFDPALLNPNHDDNTSMTGPSRRFITREEQEERAAARQKRAKEAQISLERSRERVRFYERCQTICRRIAQINDRTGLWH